MLHGAAAEHATATGGVLQVLKANRRPSSPNASQVAQLSIRCFIHPQNVLLHCVHTHHYAPLSPDTPADPPAVV
jgi:hypothetical protein